MPGAYSAHRHVSEVECALLIHMRRRRRVTTVLEINGIAAYEGADFSRTVTRL